MDINRYIQHPEELNRETLYDLRSFLALYPYHQAARLLMLQNLYLMHDPTFDEELRQAAFYITDRSTLFNLIEARHYTIAKQEKVTSAPSADRTDTLINNFLESLPEEEPAKPKRKPTAADAAIDYMSYYTEMEKEQNEKTGTKEETTQHEQNAFDSIIDNFLINEGGKLTLQEDDDYTPHNEVTIENDRDELTEDYHTETLSKIYIKQGKYLQALEIIQQLNLNNSKKNAYFADQIRFLQKIISIKSYNQAKK